MTDTWRPYHLTIHPKAWSRDRHPRTWPLPAPHEGTAERFIQTMLREWAYGRIYASSAIARRADRLEELLRNNLVRSYS